MTMTDMTIGRRAFLGGLAAGATLAFAPAALARSGGTDDRAIKALMRRYIAEGKFPGAVRAIGLGAGAPQFAASGRIAFGDAPAAGSDTLWRIYSMTKPITGMAAMMLIEDGRFALDTDIAEFIPGFARPRVLTDPAASLASRPAARGITIRHLLTHTAGLGYSIITKGPLLEEYNRLGLLPAPSRPGQTDLAQAAAGGSSAISTARPTNLADFADKVATLPLIADPGTIWSYSMGLDVLGRIIEIAAGTPFDCFLAERIFQPLGMKDTMFLVPAADLSRLATNYALGPDGPTVVDAPADSVYAMPQVAPWGGAGLVSTARDYDRFLAMLLGEGSVEGRRIMTRETARLGMSNLLPPGVAGPGGSGFGAGGRVTLVDQPGGEGQGTYGWAGAAGTLGWVDRKRGLRAGWFVQYMPSQALPLMTEVPAAVYADLRA